MNKFDIKRPYPGYHISINIPFEAKRGQAIMRDTTNSANGALASGRFVGFLVRDVVDGGPGAVDRHQLYPGRLELADTMNGECSLELADAVEAEGPDYVVTSGTGAISGATAIGTELSFNNGKFRVKQSADQALFKLGGVPDPVDSGEVRILAERIV